MAPHGTPKDEGSQEPPLITPGGTYTMRAKVNLFRQFTESSYSNNCSWAKIRFNTTGSSVSVLDTGSTCIDDMTGHRFEAEADWAREQGISAGCGGTDMYCPSLQMRRERVQRRLDLGLVAARGRLGAELAKQGGTRRVRPEQAVHVGSCHPAAPVPASSW